MDSTGKQKKANTMVAALLKPQDPDRYLLLLVNSWLLHASRNAYRIPTAIQSYMANARGNQAHSSHRLMGRQSPQCREIRKHLRRRPSHHFLPEGHVRNDQDEDMTSTIRHSSTSADLQPVNDLGSVLRSVRSPSLLLYTRLHLQARRNRVVLWCIECLAHCAPPFEVVCVGFGGAGRADLGTRSGRTAWYSGPTLMWAPSCGRSQRAGCHVHGGIRVRQANRGATRTGDQDAYVVRSAPTARLRSREHHGSALHAR